MRKGGRVLGGAEVRKDTRGILVSTVLGIIAFFLPVRKGKKND